LRVHAEILPESVVVGAHTANKTKQMRNPGLYPLFRHNGFYIRGVFSGACL
jgi:hypothetical protein